MVVSVAKFLQNYLSVFANAVGGLLLAFGGLSGLNPWEDGWVQFALSFPGVVFMIGAALILLGAYAGIRRTRTVGPLLKKLEKYEAMSERLVGTHYDLCSTTLARISRDTFGYGDTERISVYRHRGGNAFQIMGRHSEDITFKRKGRLIYPADQGVLGHAWRHRVATTELPDPHKQSEEYYRVLEDEWNISRRVAEGFTMKSRSLVACARYDLKGIDPVAVVVVESTEVGILEEDRVREAVNGKEGDLIYDFFEMMQPLEPNAEDTHGQGF